MHGTLARLPVVTDTGTAMTPSQHGIPHSCPLAPTLPLPGAAHPSCVELDVSYCRAVHVVLHQQRAALP